MAIGKGFFWGGLADSVKNMYNQDWNARMAEQARMASGLEADEERKEKRAQFDRMFPSGKDTLPQDVNNVNDAIGRVDAEIKNLEASAGNIMASPEDKAKTNAALAERRAHKAALEKVQTSLLSKGSQRHGGPAVSPAAPANNDINELRSVLFGK